MKNWLVAALLAASAAQAAEISNLPEQKGVSMLLFSGAIEPGDARKVELAVGKATLGNSVVLMLLSPGGSVAEAMRIGDFLDKNEIGAMVLPGMSCSSSCVFILAGANSKTIKGKVGIHRPFVTDLSLTGEAASATLGQVVAKVKDYLDKKGIAPSLADDMFSVEPHKIRYLTDDELSRYRLDQPNYMKQERRDIQTATEMGITRQELIA